ncbi:MAG: dihydroorotate dehydrogenase-like protein [Calditrichia bacterium]
MADLSTEYLGIPVKNPILISSSTLVQSPEGVKEAEEAGAAGVVLRSLFEEIIQQEIESRDTSMWSGHPEEYDYILAELQLQYGPRKYLELIEKAKNSVSIPIIASINCISPKWWINYAKQIEAAGADALELNLSIMPTNPGRTSLDIEQEFLAIIRAAKEAVKIPLAVKLGPYFTSLSRFANQICGAGVSALVLFNRFYQFDINIDKQEITGANWFSSPTDMNQSLRWISILYKHVNCQLVANTGIHDGKALIKQLLAGAQMVEIASAIYLHGFSRVGEMLNDLNSYMDQHGYQKLSDFRGKLSLSERKDPEMYERLQYIKALTGIETK